MTRPLWCILLSRTSQLYCDTISCVSNLTVVYFLQAAMSSGPKVRFGTKLPSMTSNCASQERARGVRSGGCRVSPACSGSGAHGSTHPPTHHSHTHAHTHTQAHHETLLIARHLDTVDAGVFEPLAPGRNARRGVAAPPSATPCARAYACSALRIVLCECMRRRRKGCWHSLGAHVGPVGRKDGRDDLDGPRLAVEHGRRTRTALRNRRTRHREARAQGESGKHC